MQAKSVTILDHEPMIRQLLMRAAASWGYACRVASSTEAFFRIFDQNPTPIAVIDLDLDDRKGLWLVHQIRSGWPNAYIVAMTADRNNDAAIECLNAGAHRYFHKPIRLDEFRHALETTHQIYTLQREHERHHDQLLETVRRQTQQLRTTFYSAIDSLVRAMEARDLYASGHSWRVRRYALRLAKRLELPARERLQLSLAAKLHDIGKVGVPEAILNKPGTLTAEEMDAIRAHPVIGERILAPIVRRPTVLATIRGHHERLDGSGYPDHLAGDAIPLLARVLTIVDCFDAMTTSRAYRGAMTMPQAFELLRAGSGTQFEPRFVRVFLDMARRWGNELPFPDKHPAPAPREIQPASALRLLAAARAIDN